MYWSVLGVILAVEYVGEWLVRWIPLYWLFKMIFLLYLALPQTQGSTFVYRTLLAPFLDEHESEIDSTVSSVKARVFVFLQEKLRAAWDALYAGLLNQAATAAPPANAPPPGGPGGSAQPTLADPVSGPAGLVFSLWQSYGPTIVMKGTALLAAASANASAAAAHVAPPPPVRASSSSSDPRQFRDELAAPYAQADIPPANNSSLQLPGRGDEPTIRRTRTSLGFEDEEGNARQPPIAASMYLPEGAPSTDPTGRYERVNHEDAEGDPLLSPGGGPRIPSGGGWFGGWGLGGHGGYEKVKTD